MFPSHFTGTTLCAALSKRYDFSTNYHACMAMPTWCRCGPPILFWPWPLFNLFPRSYLILIFLIDLNWGGPLCVQCMASKSYIFSTNYHVCMAMPTWCWCAPPICFDLDLHLTCFCFVHVNQHAYITSNCGRGHIPFMIGACFHSNFSYILLWITPNYEYGRYLHQRWIPDIVLKC